MSEEEVKDMDKEIAKEGPVEAPGDDEEGASAAPFAPAPSAPAPSAPIAAPSVSSLQSSVKRKNPKNING
jgi:hypothetical protein